MLVRNQMTKKIQDMGFIHLPRATICFYLLHLTSYFHSFHFSLDFDNATRLEILFSLSYFNPWNIQFLRYSMKIPNFHQLCIHFSIVPKNQGLLLVCFSILLPIV